ncbi:TPA: DEAD/DEAH box helicase [Acinetobacter baumannii]|uniref:DEAD/DEAH box helicase n=12 Tax=Acinetobacter baumannii TaxID=470 RepID=UPI0002BC2EA3|nr:DEAD/DEAH box helicase [Acinetobacter baumannii]AGH35663.1 helicase domain-containing protein [Acinetobacter baumannii D1279779]EKT9843790.1 DEAD/DEAH box helicase [Acinetobacter baumannii]EKT9847675.1 DEAD/DEAH box helicase [Acinetobacter baumannii]EKV2134362.1 DEAD/DEAH box helicase [Acinetobacter baumannii]MCJ9252438.1 DEAD/DEAH box helicase [Acinetobacter baumannii]
MKVNALEYICERIVDSQDFNKKYDDLVRISSNLIFFNTKNNSNFVLNIEDQNKILKYCDFLSNSDKANNRNLALKIVALIDEVAVDNNYKELIKKSVLNKFGLFSASDAFSSENIEISASTTIISELRKINQSIAGTNEIYTNNQYDLYNEIINKKYFSFSGPTSIGKSFLIKNCAIQLSNRYKNIIFILPTKALLDEFVISFRKIINQQKIEDLNIGKTVSKFRRDKNNILVLTQERYNSFLYAPEFSNINVDILFVDEAHKLLGKTDTRSVTLFKVIKQSISKFPDMKLIFSCPIISNPDILFEIFDIKDGASKTVKESPVSQNLYSVDIGETTYQYFDIITNKIIDIVQDRKHENDFDLIYSIGTKNDSNLIYSSSKQDCINKAVKFKEYLLSIGETIVDDEELISESDLISNYIHNEFSLVELIKYKVAFHHGGLPIFIRKRIEDLYAKRKIKYIFCTSTLLEGVNLPTKNVFIYPFKITNKDESTKLNFWNLAGRAGRYKNELTGNIFCINNPSDSFNKKEILTKNEVELKDNLTKSILSEKKILNYLNDKVKSPDSAIVQFSTMLLSEILSYKKNNKLGPNLLSLPYSTREKIIEAGENYILRKKINNINISVFSESHTINPDVQSKALRYAKDNRNILSNFKRLDFFQYIEMINNIYNIFRNDILYIYQNISYSWVRGGTIKEIINNSIDYSKKVLVNYSWTQFDKNNSEHVNAKISQIITILEYEIGFKLETSVNHFYQLCKSIHGEEASGINLAKYLEYGTINTKEMAVQEYGFSRAAASQLLKSYSDYLNFDENDELLSVDLKNIIINSEDNILLNREAKWLS